MFLIEAKIGLVSSSCPNTANTTQVESPIPISFHRIAVW